MATATSGATCATCTRSESGRRTLDTCLNAPPLPPPPPPPPPPCVARDNVTSGASAAAAEVQRRRHACLAVARAGSSRRGCAWLITAAATGASELSDISAPASDSGGHARMSEKCPSDLPAPPPACGPAFCRSPSSSVSLRWTAGWRWWFAKQDDGAPFQHTRYLHDQREQRCNAGTLTRRKQSTADLKRDIHFGSVVRDGLDGCMSRKASQVNQVGLRRRRGAEHGRCQRRRRAWRTEEARAGAPHRRAELHRRELPSRLLQRCRIGRRGG